MATEATDDEIVKYLVSMVPKTRQGPILTTLGEAVQLSVKAAMREERGRIADILQAFYKQASKLAQGSADGLLTVQAEATVETCKAILTELERPRGTCRKCKGTKRVKSIIASAVGEIGRASCRERV